MGGGFCDTFIVIKWLPIECEVLLVAILGLLPKVAAALNDSHWITLCLPGKVRQQWGQEWAGKGKTGWGGGGMGAGRLWMGVDQVAMSHARSNTFF